MLAVPLCSVSVGQRFASGPLALSILHASIPAKGFVYSLSLENTRWLSLAAYLT